MNAIFEHVLLAAGLVFATLYLISLCILMHHDFIEGNINF